MLNEGLLPIIVAGLINGSFVVPSRYIQNTSSAKIWLYHSLIGLAIIPWLILLFLSGSILHDYSMLSVRIWSCIILGGLIFGVGQFCFSNAIAKIGIALSFAINLGIGITIGSMFVVLHDSAFFTTRGFIVTSAVILVVCSLIFYYFSQRDTEQGKGHYQAGWLLASFAGIASGLQNVTFMFVGFYENTQLQSANSFWVWPPFLLSAAISMGLLFFYQMKKKQESVLLGDLKYLILIFLMGLCFTGSLVLYSNGMSQLPAEQKMLGWPTLMILIIFTSQIWGWLFGEFKKSKKVYRIVSVLLLIMSVALLSI